MTEFVFICPKCGRQVLYENEIGLAITRIVRGIDSQRKNIIYDDYWISEPSKKWWSCAKCGFTIPEATVEGLEAWLREQEI